MNPFLTKSFPATVNGDNVIAFTDAKNYKTSLVEHNLGSLASCIMRIRTRIIWVC